MEERRREEEGGGGGGGGGVCGCCSQLMETSSCLSWRSCLEWQESRQIGGGGANIQDDLIVPSPGGRRQAGGFTEK